MGNRVSVFILSFALLITYPSRKAIARPQTTSLNGQIETRSADPTQPSFLDRIDSITDFNRLARVFYGSRFQGQPHLMFAIDRRDHQRIYYINSNTYRFHKDFINASYLSLERGRAFFEHSYLNSGRRFLLGTLAYDGATLSYTFEFWEGDLLTADLLGETLAAVRKSFFSAVIFKPNSQTQVEAAEKLNSGLRDALPTVSTELAGRSAYESLNEGSAIGQLRVIEQVTPETVIDRNQIVIFRAAPLQLTPLSGLIMSEPTSPLSHVNMLAKSWGIPNAYIKGADKLYRRLEGRYVRLEVLADEYHLVPADIREVEARNREWIKRSDLITPRADLKYNRLTDLKYQRSRDAGRFGAKSANLGELIHANVPGVIVPRGFTIPFHYYQAFIHRNALEERISRTIEEDRFVHDPQFRKQKLAQIREWIRGGRHDEGLTRRVLNKAHTEYSRMGLFVRSSTNAEDLPNFSGAGLYTTVPNVRGDDQLMEAIKVVWASVWNYEAYEARESFGINHQAVYPAVLIQQGIEAESAGVAVTSDPFNPDDADGVYINAKHGLGIRVVEGKRVPEQVIYNPRTNTIRVLTRSDEDTLVAFDERGGVKELKIDSQRAVLTDDMIRRLAAAALRIKRVFSGVDQDLEWLYLRQSLYVVQSRPFIRGS